MVEISLTGDQMLTVLETVAEHGPVSAAEVAHHCQINRTVAHRLLVTLARRAYIRRDAEGYSLGPAIIALSRQMEADIASLAREAMESLAKEVGETVVLHCIDNGEAVVVDQALGQRHLVRVQHKPGSRHPLHLGASGWSILAFQDVRTQARLMRKLDDPAAAADRIAKIRSDGYAVSCNELQLGVHGLSAPLLGPGGKCFASLGILVPAIRGDLLITMTKHLLTAASKISNTWSRQL